jgi:hypothetical protein
MRVVYEEKLLFVGNNTTPALGIYLSHNSLIYILVI